MKNLLSIVIPIYYEEGNVKKLISGIERNVKTKKEILMIYDFNEDPTVNVIKALNKKAVCLVKNFTGNKRGVVNAIKSGFKKAKVEAVLVVMADLADDLRIVDKMFKKITQ